MKLTNEHRRAFAEKVVHAIPLKHPQDKGKTSAILEGMAMKLVSPEILKIRKEEPSAVTYQCASIRWNCLDPRGEPKLGWETVYVYRIPVKANENLFDKVKDENGKPNSLKFVNAEVQAVMDEYSKYLEEQMERRALVDTIESKARGATTLEALKKLFPDLTELMPKEEKRAVVVYQEDKETMSKLKKAGLKLPVREKK